MAPSGVRVVVDARVTGQLVGAREALGAAGELAGVRLLARMRADVPRLVLEAVEGLVTEGAFVGARQVGALLAVRSWGHGGHHADRSHFGVALVLAVVKTALLVGVGSGRRGIEQT